MKTRTEKTAVKNGRGGIQTSIRECFQLLVKSCDRYGQFKQSKAPEVMMDMERIIMWKRLMLLFNMDPDRRN